MSTVLFTNLPSRLMTTSSKSFFAAAILLAAIAVAGIASPAVATSESDDPPVVLFGDCVDVVAFVDGIERSAVAEETEPFQPIELPGDTTMLFVHALWCDPTEQDDGGAVIHNRVVPIQLAQFSAVIKRPTGSDSVCPIAAFELCDWYLFDWVSESGELVGWLQDGTGLGQTARHGNLDFRYDREEHVDNFSIHVPGLFEMAGRLDDARRYPAFPTTAKGAYWAGTSAGIVKIGSWNATGRLSPVPIDLTITPLPGTLMSELFGGQSRTATNPFGSIVFSCGFYQNRCSRRSATCNSSPLRGHVRDEGLVEASSEARSSPAVGRQ